MIPTHDSSAKFADLDPVQVLRTQRERDELALRVRYLEGQTPPAQPGRVLVIVYDNSERTVAAGAYGPFLDKPAAETWARKRYGPTKEDAWQDYCDADGEPVYTLVLLEAPENLEARTDPGPLPADPWDDDPEPPVHAGKALDGEPEIVELGDDDLFLPLVQRAQQVLTVQPELPDGHPEPGPFEPQRNFAQVMNQLLACIPPTEPSLRMELQRLHDEAYIRAPEMIHLSWMQCGEVLDARFGPGNSAGSGPPAPDLQEPWVQALSQIWFGQPQVARVQPPPTPIPEPTPPESTPERRKCIYCNDGWTQCYSADEKFSWREKCKHCKGSGLRN